MKQIGQGENNIEDINIIDAKFEDVTDLQNTIDDELNGIFAEFGGDPNDVEFRIKVEKVVEGRGELEHCFSCVPEELPIYTRIENDYGSGQYKITVYKNKVIYRRRKITIAQKIGKEKENIGDSRLYLTQNDQIQELLKDRKDQSDKYERLMLSIIANNQAPAPTAPPINYAEMMTAGAAMFTAVVAAIKPEKSGGVEEVLQTVQLVKEMNDGGGNSEPNLLSAFAQSMPDLLKAGLNSQPEQPQQPHPQQPHPQQPHPQQPHPQQPHPQQPQQQKEQDELNALKYQLDLLVVKAANDSDPDVYADVILDSFSSEQIELFIKRPDVFEYLVSINPAVGNYPGWFKSLIESVINGLDADQEELNEGDVDQAESKEVKEKKQKDEISSTSKTEKATDQ